MIVVYSDGQWAVMMVVHDVAGKRAATMAADMAGKWTSLALHVAGKWTSSLAVYVA